MRRIAIMLWAYISAPRPPATIPWHVRLCVAIPLGVAATLFAYHQLIGRAWLASDFEYDLRAANRLLAGLDPYNDPTTHYGLPYPFDAQFPYPLFAALLAIPFTPFPSYVAGALYVGCLSTLMAFAVTRDGWWRLCIFLSPSYFVVASVANWSPLLVAAAFLPSLYPLAIVKPTMIAPIMINFPNLRGFLLCIPMLLLSLLIMPDWPWRWLVSLANQPPGKYIPPLFVGLGFLVLFAAVWWRQRSARLLVMLACIPQHAFFYDQLLLWLLPRTLWQSLTLSAVTWIGYLLWFPFHPAGKWYLAYDISGLDLTWTVPCFYLPSLGLVAWQRYDEVRRERHAAGAMVSTSKTILMER